MDEDNKVNQQQLSGVVKEKVEVRFHFMYLWCWSWRILAEDLAS